MPVDRFSLCVIPIRLFCGGCELGTATGFLWSHHEKVFLVSNWHVFSGRTPRTGQPISKEGAVPDMISFLHFNVVKSETDEFSLPIHTDRGDATWIEHKQLGQNADVAALDVSNLVKDRVFGNIRGRQFQFCLNTLDQVDDALLQIANDLFILGFPLGLQPSAFLPIWKRASVASEPDYPINGLPCFYVDTATREGMSGSPVLLRTGRYQRRQDGNGTGFYSSMSGDITQFVGIYSGRNIGRDHEAQLGLIWKREVLDELLADPAAGSFELRD